MPGRPLIVSSGRRPVNGFGPPIRAKMTGIMAIAVFQDRSQFRTLLGLLAVNTHFNGAAEMLERIEAALRLSSLAPELPVPNQLAQNGNMTLGLVWDDLSLVVSSDVILWRFCKTGEPHSVTDAATRGVPLDLLTALAHIAKLKQAQAAAAD